MAINKVIYGNEVLIDITDTTATAMSVQSGAYFYDKAGIKTLGLGSALGDEIEILINGGTAHHITGIDLSQDTVTAAALLSGYTAHDSTGTAIVGTYVPSGGSGSAYVDGHCLVVTGGIIGV